MIDVHAHLLESYFPDIDEVLSRAKNGGVKAIINSITSPRESSYALELLQKHPGYVFLTIGFDPTCTSREEFERFTGLLESERSRIVGIGEVGLDHFYIRDEAGRQVQRDFFIQCIELSAKHDLPLIVHSRSAGRKAIELMSSTGSKRILMHAFDGKAGDAEKAAKEGFYFSIPPSIVRSEQKQKLARILPLESIMLESDSPALSPNVGERNEPLNILKAALKISEVKHVPVEEVIGATTANAREFFKINF